MIPWLGWAFQVRPADIDESRLAGEAPGAYVLRLAEEKARAAGKLVSDGMLVLAADTTVADGDHLLGKPTSASEARAMLRQLRGRSHQVYTAVAVLDPVQNKLLLDLCVTQVPMREYSEDEIEHYIASGDPFDKAGGYAIQHAEFRPVEDLRGCYASVMGLPLCHLTRTLRKLGIHPAADSAQACQANLNYSCSIYAAVLAGQTVG